MHISITDVLFWNFGIFSPLFGQSLCGKHQNKGQKISYSMQFILGTYYFGNTFITMVQKRLKFKCTNITPKITLFWHFLFLERRKCLA